MIKRRREILGVTIGEDLGKDAAVEKFSMGLRKALEDDGILIGLVSLFVVLHKKDEVIAISFLHGSSSRPQVKEMIIKGLRKRANELESNKVDVKSLMMGMN